MKILLVSPPKSGLKYVQEFPPLGLGYLAAYLRRFGYEADIQDCIINKWDIGNLLDYIAKSKPEVVGITVFSQAMKPVREILDQLDQDYPEITTVIGGPHPTAIPEKSLQHFASADYAIAGEGEIPLLGLVNFLNSGKTKPADIPGLIWREDGGIRLNPKIEHDNLDDFGILAWDLIDPRRYFSSTRNIGKDTAVIHSSRGCPFSCEFCVRLGKKLRYRSLDSIYQEIRLLHEQYGVKRFILGDEGFPIDTRFTKSFCRYVIEKRDNFTYVAGCGLRLSVLDDEMLELMKKANFERLIGIGIESGVPRVRQLMKKSLTQEQLFRGIALLKKHGFKPSANFILGFPGETKEEMEETIRVALKLNLGGAAFAPFIPLPGCEATKKLIENGELPEDFDFSRIDLDAVLYAPKGLSTKDVDEMRRKAVFKFNSQPRMIIYHLTGKRLFWTIIKFSRIFFPSFLVPRLWRRHFNS